jgi:hypothetical protein
MSLAQAYPVQRWTGGPPSPSVFQYPFDYADLGGIASCSSHKIYKCSVRR